MVHETTLSIALINLVHADQVGCFYNI